MSLLDRAPWLTLNDNLEQLLDDLQRLFEPPAWMRDALCREPEYPPEWWHPAKGGASKNVAKATSVCMRCAVREECLAYALEHEAQGRRYGVWGGLSVTDRKALSDGGGQERVERSCEDCGDTFNIRAWTEQTRCPLHARQHTKRLSSRRARGSAA